MGQEGNLCRKKEGREMNKSTEFFEGGNCQREFRKITRIPEKNMGKGRKKQKI